MANRLKGRAFGAALGPDMNNDRRQRAAKRTAIIVALIAGVVYVGFLAMGIGLDGLQRILK